MDVRERTWIDARSDDVLRVVTDPATWASWSRSTSADAPHGVLRAVGDEVTGRFGPWYDRRPVTWRVVRRHRGIVDLEARVEGTAVGTAQISTSPWDGGCALEVAYVEDRRLGQRLVSRRLRRDLRVLARLVERRRLRTGARGRVGYAHRAPATS